MSKPYKQSLYTVGIAIILIYCQFYAHDADKSTQNGAVGVRERGFPVTVSQCGVSTGKTLQL